VSACAQIAKWKNASDATTPPPLLQFDPLNLTAPFSAADCEAIHGAGTVCPGDDVCSSDVISKFGSHHSNIQPKP
jgi:hypothetical protein